MSFTPPQLRRRLAWLVASAVAALVLLALVRRPLTALAVEAALRLAGAGEVNFRVVEVTPWMLELADVRFHLRAQRIEAGRIAAQREHWWSPSLGRITVDRLR
ncbi:MAG: hypothetical protein ACHQ5A_04335, partial [Opitutales bacterium]